MKIFVNKDLVRDLTTAVTADDEITLMQALSGG
jgi:sulfur carrier protein ThiS